MIDSILKKKKKYFNYVFCVAKFFKNPVLIELHHPVDSNIYLFICHNTDGAV